MTDIPILFLILLIIFLIILSGLFSISETSMMALNRYKLKHDAKNKNRAALTTQKLLKSTDKLLGVILLGNNLVNSGAAAIITLLTIHFYGENELSITMATLITAFLILIFSEITPKIIGARYPQRIAYFTSYFLNPLLKVTYPVIYIVNLIANFLLSMFGIKKINNDNHNLSTRELKTVVTENISFRQKNHQKIILNIIELNEISVQDVMTPKSKIDFVDLNDDEKNNELIIRTTEHDFMPICDKNFSNIHGIIKIKTILKSFEADFKIIESLKKNILEPYYIPIETPLLTQLQNFKRTKKNLGLIIDEYGEVKGLLTIADIVNQIIGDNDLNFTLDKLGFKVEDDNSVLAEGSCLIRDLNKELGFDLPISGPRTLNGLIIEYIQEIPESGTTLKIENYLIEILKKEEMAVKLARIKSVNVI